MSVISAVAGALFFLLAVLVLPAFALVLLLDVWRNRANVRANLPRACAAVFIVFLVFVSLDKWDGTPFRLEAPILASFLTATQVLARRYPSKSHS